MIIGISGKKQSGKDTVGRIMQYLTATDNKIIQYLVSDNVKLSFDKSLLLTSKNIDDYLKTDWQIVKFSDTVKDIVCLLINCTRKDLENEDFKNSKLTKEWTHTRSISNIIPFSSLTPRKLLQLVGTNCGRNIIHPDIWINSLFNKYSARYYYLNGKECNKTNNWSYSKLPNWVITDVRFENEINAIKEKNGFIIRVIRNSIKNKDNHLSEIALDNYKFDNIINNNDNLDDLINKVKSILIEKYIINDNG